MCHPKRNRKDTAIKKGWSQAKPTEFRAKFKKMEWKLPLASLSGGPLYIVFMYSQSYTPLDHPALLPCVVCVVRSLPYCMNLRLSTTTDRSHKSEKVHDANETILKDLVQTSTWSLITAGRCCKNVVLLSFLFVRVLFEPATMLLLNFSRLF